MTDKNALIARGHALLAEHRLTASPAKVAKIANRFLSLQTGTPFDTYFVNVVFTASYSIRRGFDPTGVEAVRRGA